MSFETEGGPVPRRPQTGYSNISRVQTGASSTNRRSEESGQSGVGSGSGNANGEKKGIFGRLRPGTSNSGSGTINGGSVNGGDGSGDDEGFKSRLLLGGQKLLNKLPHSGKDSR